MHAEIFRFDCTICDKKFRYVGGLKCHMATHTGERPFKCGLCPMTFKNTSSAAVHRRIHKQDNMFVCTMCQLKFVNMSRLNFHMRDEHNCPILDMGNVPVMVGASFSDHFRQFFFGFDLFFWNKFGYVWYGHSIHVLLRSDTLYWSLSFLLNFSFFPVIVFFSILYTTFLIRQFFKH